MKHILILTSHTDSFETLEQSMKHSCKLDLVDSYLLCCDFLKSRKYDTLLLDYEVIKHQLQDESYTAYMSLFSSIKDISPEIEIIILTNSIHLTSAVQAVKAGANNYLTYPVNEEEFSFILENIHEKKVKDAELTFLRDSVKPVVSSDAVPSNNAGMRKVLKQLQSVASTKSTVLIHGETGTGKGVFANLIHQSSLRKNKPFIAIHCGAIPDSLIESELFGYEKGAFTSAAKRKLGKLEIANGGTVFLDEIGTIPEHTQIKLLKVLQEKSFQRIGGNDTIHVDVRFIAASNEDLKELVNKGKFRIDLFYRLNVFPIDIPPLRSRPEDIEALALNFLKNLNREYGKKITRISKEVMSSLKTYSWPGNVRELENVIERAYILEESEALAISSFPDDIIQHSVATPKMPVSTSKTLSEIRTITVNTVEKEYLTQVLRDTSGNISRAAECAAITTRQLHKLMQKHCLKKEEFKKKK